MTSLEGKPPTIITRWLLDTRSIWPGTRITDSASDCLDLVSEDERKLILRKYRIEDARLSLGSALLKRAYIVQCTGLSWNKIHFERKGHPVHGKPAWRPPHLEFPGYPWPKIDFNISHQAGLVTLVGACTPAQERPANETWRNGEGNDVAGEDIEVLVSCDIVCANERQDMESIRQTGFDEWTSAFDQAFSHDELWDITYNLPSRALTLLNGEEVDSHLLGRLDRIIVCDQDIAIKMPDGRFQEFSSDLIIETKLRRFYTFFALKEGYIKLVGEGLLAPWITKCEFRNVKSPKPGTVARCSAHGVWGGRVTGGVHHAANEAQVNGHSNGMNNDDELEIYLNDVEILDVRTEIQAFEENYQIATMVRPSNVLASNEDFPQWDRIDLEHDILERARAPGK